MATTARRVDGARQSPTKLGGTQASVTRRDRLSTVTRACVPRGPGASTYRLNEAQQAETTKYQGRITMSNTKFAVKGNILTITIDLSQNLGMSATGKSQMVASTHGNVLVEGTDGLTVGLNAYRKVQKAA